MSADAPARAGIERAFSAGFRLIASSSAVRDMLVSMGAAVDAVIPCGLDFDSFGCDVQQEARAPFTVGFPARQETFKGTADAIECMEILRSQYGKRLLASAFGSSNLGLPSWIRWVERPSADALRAFYNQQKVFVMPSHYEGWGLTGIESMACGCALVCADNGGSRDFALHGETALVVPPKRPDLLAKAVSSLLEDELSCAALARRGQSFSRRFGWPESVDRVEKLLLEIA